MVNFKIMARFGNTNFDLDYCKHFTPAQLRKIYNGTLSEDVELLIAELYPDEAVEKPKKEKNIKEK